MAESLACLIGFKITIDFYVEKCRKCIEAQEKFCGKTNRSRVLTIPLPFQVLANFASVSFDCHRKTSLLLFKQ